MQYSVTFVGLPSPITASEANFFAAHSFAIRASHSSGVADGDTVVAILARVEHEGHLAELIRQRQISPMAHVLIVGSDTPSPLLQKIVNQIPNLRFLPTQNPSESWNAHLEDLKIQLDQQAQQEDLRKLETKKYKDLSELNKNLEDLVNDRTIHLKQSHNEEKLKLKQERDLLQFMLEMQRTLDLGEVFVQLRKNLKLHREVHEVFLLHESGNRSRLRFMQNLSMKTITFMAPLSNFTPTDQSLTWMTMEEQVALAKAISRPLRRILRVSLCEGQDRVELWLEVNQHDGSIIEFVEKITGVVKITKLVIDRILHDESAALASQRWAQIFDGLKDPIAIVTKSFHVVRSNARFQRVNDSTNCYERFAGRNSPCEGCPLTGAPSSAEGLHNIQVGEKFFTVHSKQVGSSRFVHYYQDNTEIRMLYARLIQTEKLGALGALAGQVAHELNNPLSGIRNLSQVIRSQLPAEEVMATDLLEIEKAAQRCQNIIHQLLEFSRSEGLEVVSCSLDDLIARTIPLLKTAMRNHRIQMDLQAADVCLKVEPQLIQQVIFNLVQNACQAMMTAGQLTIRTRLDAAGKYAEFQIQDTGGGISPSVQPRLFEAFYTTKPHGQGTGLGLYLSKKILERFGGTIDFTSSPQGTVFVGRLPQWRGQ